jgi:hypothetical protein
MAARRRKTGGVSQTRTLKRGPNKGDTVKVRASSAGDLAKGNWYPVKSVKDRGPKRKGRLGKAAGKARKRR